MPAGRVVGVDVGGTSVRAGLVDGRGRVLRRVKVDSGRTARRGEILDGIAEAVRRVAEGDRVRAAGLGIAGAMTGEGVMTQSPNLPALDGVDLKRELRRRLPMPLAFDNDANLFALGEWWRGAGKGADVVVGLTIGTGVGGGLVIGGEVYRGAHGFAAEFGHMSLNPQGPACACGARGCLEAYVGGTALKRLAAEGTMRLGEADLDADPKTLYDSAARGEAWARTVVDEAASWLGAGLANLVNALNPDVVVIGGSIGQRWPLMRERALATMRAQAMRQPGKRVRVARAKLGDDAAVIGGAKLAWDAAKAD